MQKRYLKCTYFIIIIRILLFKLMKIILGENKEGVALCIIDVKYLYSMFVFKWTLEDSFFCQRIR